MDKEEMIERALNNHAKICQVPKCPEKTSARVTDGGRRKDLCRRHAIVTTVHIEGTEVIAAWNELTMEDFDD